MSSIRLERVAELLKRELGEAIRRHLPVSEAGLVSVNEVAITGDLREATVYVSVLGNLQQQKRGFELLIAQRSLIQEHVARAVILKYTPKLRFQLDDSVARGNHVLEILDEIEKSTPPQPH
jgi:ribosome-binding factor A